MVKSMLKVFYDYQGQKMTLAKIELADNEIVRIYGKRWDIEVFYKEGKIGSILKTF